jgi:hypothetical protein
MPRKKHAVTTLHPLRLRTKLALEDAGLVIDD